MMGTLGGGVDVAAMAVQGSCTFTDYGVVTMSDGNAYRLVAITGSGNIVLSSAVNCEVCVVGGGADGLSGMGGAGAYMKNQVIKAFRGGAVVVGAAQGASSIGNVSVSAVSGKNGGTGGGGFGPSSTVGGTGDRLLKYPFGDRNYDLWAGKPHCAGGSGGSNFTGSYNNNYRGGPGGTNGLSGGDAIKGQDTSSMPGGTYGGGAGGSASVVATDKGENGSYYGAGGGGGGYKNDQHASGGSGYQGIVYVRIPVIQ